MRSTGPRFFRLAALVVNGGPHACDIYINATGYPGDIRINGSHSRLIDIAGDLRERFQIAADNRGICLIPEAGWTRRMYMGVPTHRRAQVPACGPERVRAADSTRDGRT